MKKIIKIIARILAWFLLGIIALLVIVLIAIQTAPVKKEIVRIAEKQVNNILNAELSVGRLTGNFFTNLQLYDVALLSAEKDTIAFIPELTLRYRLLPLLKGEIMVNELVIEKPFVSLEQLADSTWNVQHIVFPSEEEKDSTSSFNMSIQVDRLNLNNGHVDIVSFSRQIPKQVDSLYLDITAHYETNYQEANLRDLRFVTHEPDLAVRKLLIQGTGDKEKIDLSELILQTRENSLRVKGEYYFDSKEKSQVNLNMTPIHLDEFRYYLPDSFKLKATPELALDATLENSRLRLNLLLKERAQEIGLNVISHHLIEYFSDLANAPVDYDASLRIKQVDVSYWLDDPALNYIVNGDLTAKGEGFDPKTMQANVKGNFGNVVLYGKPVKKLDIILNYDEGNADGVIDGAGSFGRLYVKPTVKKLMSSYPLYTLYLTTQDLNLAPVMGPKYETDINLNASVKGGGFKLDKINANAELVMKPSSGMGLKLDTLETQVDFARQNLIINSFLLRTLSAQLEADGNYNMKGNSDLNLQVEIDSAQDITQLLGIEGLETSLNLAAHVSGQPDSLNADLKLKVGPTSFQEIRVDSLFVNADGSMRGKNIDIDADLHANKLVAGGFNMDNVDLTAQTDTKSFTLGFEAKGEDIHTRLSGLIKLGDAIEIMLSGLWLDYRGYALQQQAQDTSFISIGKTEYKVKNFHLVSDSLTSQSVYADGVINREGEQDFKLDITDLDLSEIIKLFAPKQEIKGLLNFNAQLAGAAQSPQLTAILDLDSTAVQQFRFDSIQSKISLLDNQLDVSLEVVPLDSGKIYANGKLPVDVRLDSMKFNVVPKGADPLYFRLGIDKLPLAILSILLPVDEIAGNIESEISVDGTMDKPEITGDLDIVDGLVKMNLYGINYRDIQTAIHVGNNQVKIDTFLIRSRQGTMQANGSVLFDSELYKGQLNTSELNILFNRFNPVDNKGYNMEMSGNVDLNGKRDSVYFSGKLVIPEAQVYLPAVMALFGKRTVPDIPKPLLVLEQEKMENLPDSIVYTFHPDSVDVQSPKFDFLNNLQGSLDVEIPRNTWIRNDDMRFELSGDVEVRKHRDFFELFGTVDVVRGQYNLLGKVFVIQSGTITFQGGEKLNPVLDVQAVYSFRSSQQGSERKELIVNVTGELLSPEIKFSMDDAEVSEGDAVSYILFGTKMDDISGSLDGSSVSASNIAGSLASMLISSQLTKLLGNSLPVDYIEFNSTSDFKNASIVVGKYITNKLFVSYEQNIGNLENLNDKTVPRYEMTLEYELFKFLFLQLTSSPITNGFDVIFKLNSKQ